MNSLQLNAGPALILSYPERGGDGKYKARFVDVTHRAHEHLFSVVQLDPALTLRDIFGLLAASPILVEVYRRSFANELLTHVQSAPAVAPAPEYAPDAIEYLELYHNWQFNTGTNELQPLGVMGLHGIGFELREDFEFGSSVERKGTRIQWSVSLTDVRELLSLPLRICSKVTVSEDDIDAKLYGQTVKEFSYPSVTLGELLHGVLWGLSFYGAPAEQAEVVASLRESSEELKSFDEQGPLEGGSNAHDFFAELDAPGIEACFEPLGTVAARDVGGWLRQLDDLEPVQAGLDRLLREQGAAADLRVKPEYAGLPAKAFRRLFRQARTWKLPTK